MIKFIDGLYINPEHIVAMHIDSTRDSIRLDMSTGTQHTGTFDRHGQLHAMVSHILLATSGVYSLPVDQD